MVNKHKKDELLANDANEERVINLLSASFRQADHKTLHAKGDADVLIVQTAVESSETSDAAVVGDDPDLLVLLCYHAEMEWNGLLFALQK